MTAPAFDASCLLEEVCGVVRGELPVKGDRLLTELEAARLTRRRGRTGGRTALCSTYWDNGIFWA